MEKILVVIDMQNDFIDGVLGTKEAEAIVDKVVEKIKSYSPENVYYTMDTHEEDYLQTQEGKYLPIEHCIKRTEGWKYPLKIGELLTSHPAYTKDTFGTFELAADILWLAERKEIEIEIIGLCTDICVISNALILKAAVPNVSITVDSSCCAGTTPEAHEAALTVMKSCQINVK